MANSFNKHLIFTIFALGFTLGAYAHEDTPVKADAKPSNIWSEVKSPIRGTDEKPEVIGAYSNGCMRNAHELAISNKYWEVVNVSRGRNFAHPDMVPFLQFLGEWSTASGHGKVILGDLSQAAGGPMPYGHASHQVGLDVDIRFSLANPNERMDDAVREGYPQDPVAKHQVSQTLGNYSLRSNLIDQRWKPSYGDLLAKAAEYDRVERIFVSPPIKKALCDRFKPEIAAGKYPAWLLKVQPYYGHDAHFHVRLTCPKENKNCKPQGPPAVRKEDPTRVGCDGPALNWWMDDKSKKGTFMADAIADLSKEDEKPSSPPAKPANKLDKMPQECKNLIRPPAAKDPAEAADSVR